MKTEIWLAWRLLFTRRNLLSGSSLLSLLGLILGVASLVTAMAVVSGFEVTLRDSVSDVTGHVQVLRHARNGDSSMDIFDQIRGLSPSYQAASRFLRVEALLANKGKVQGVLLQGMENLTPQPTLNIHTRIVAGTDDLKTEGETPAALAGLGLAKTYNLKPGDRVKIVMPIPDPINPEKFNRKVSEFVIRGVVDLGKYEWNERLLLTDLKPLQTLASVGDRDHGLILKYPSTDIGLQEARKLARELGFAVSVVDWRELNENLFEAVRIERVAIFFVIYVILAVTAFNVASTLFVSVIRRTEEISLLKAMGLTRNATLRVFSAQGIFFGAIALVLGIVMGIVFSEAFSLLQGRFEIMSAAVYRVHGIQAHVRFADLLAIAICTLLTCLLATLMPARRAAKLSPIEGLRHE